MFATFGLNSAIADGDMDRIVKIGAENQELARQAIDALDKMESFDADGGISTIAQVHREHAIYAMDQLATGKRFGASRYVYEIAKAHPLSTILSTAIERISLIDDDDSKMYRELLLRDHPGLAGNGSDVSSVEDIIDDGAGGVVDRKDCQIA